jgi:hypothetical protein
MRIRSIVPKFWESEDIERLDWDTRLLFIGLWSYVDDNGVGRDSEALIASALFPLSRDPLDTRARVSKGLQALSEGGQITRYTVDGVRVIYVVSWDKYQRVDHKGKDRYPRPTSEDFVSNDLVETPSRESRESLAPGEGEKGRRGEGLEPSSSPPSDDPEDPPSEVVLKLCDRLATHIERNTGKRPSVIKSWHKSARLLLERDGYPLAEVIRILDWSQQDTFWSGNILSMPKFREKYPQLKIKSRATQVNGRAGYGKAGERKALY